jgi:hypothetical protein
MSTTPAEVVTKAVTDERVECVGSLLVHTSDVKELSYGNNKPDKDEMVGSLLVLSRDVQELTGTAGIAPQKDSPSVMERMAEDLSSPTKDDFNPWANH